MKFSVVCLTYKRPRLLEESVFSVLQQTCQDFELLIVNDCASHRIRFDHPKVRVLNLSTRIETLGDKRNFGKANALGDLVLQLDDDDLLLPTYLEKLADLIGDHDWLSIQKPILYYEDHSKICLSGIPLTNTFLYRRAVGEAIHYPAAPPNFIGYFDELTPFYDTVVRKFRGSAKLAQLKPEDCGYVWRQDSSPDRGYITSKFKTETVQKQNQELDALESPVGDIVLTPQWSRDYTAIVRANFKQATVPKFALADLQVTTESLQKARESLESWRSVKPSWETAAKFVEAVSSRGIGATIADALGLSKTRGNRVTEEVYAQRHLSCFGDPSQNVEPCSRLRVIKEKGHFCGSCGCGDSKLAKLDGEGYTKLHYPHLECPLKRRGFSNYEIGLDTKVSDT